MALVVPAGLTTTQFGNVTQIIIAESVNWSSEAATDPTPLIVAPNGATSGGDFYPQQLRVAGADIAREGTTIAQSEFDGSAAKSKDAAGAYDVANSIDFLLSGNGTGLLFRNLTQTKNPLWNILNGTGTTLPATVNVVANTALLKSTSEDATIADDLSSTTNPAQLVVTPSSTATISGIQGRVYLKGTDHMDRVIDENLNFPASAPTTALTSSLWYKTVTQISSSGFEEASGKTYGVTARDVAARVQFIPQDRRLVSFLTAEVAKGEIPNIYYSLLINEMTMDITRDGLLVANCAMLGRNSKLRTNLAGDTGPTALPTETPQLRKAQGNIYPGLRAVLTAEDTDIAVDMQEATFSVNQDYEYTDVLGKPYQISQPGRNDKRLVQIEATVLYTPENDYSEYFENNSTLPNVKLTFQEEGLGAFPYKLSIIMPETQLTADPDPAVTDPGSIQQTLNIQAIRGRRAYEYYIEAEYSSFPLMRVYA